MSERALGVRRMDRKGWLTTAACALLLGAWATGARAQWPVYGGGNLTDGVVDTAIDARGNVYVLGEFRGTATIGPETLNAKGLGDLFVAKYSPDGAPVWVRSAGGPSADKGLSILVDASENVYITGYFSGQIDFVNSGLLSIGAISLPPSNRTCTGACGVGNQGTPNTAYAENSLNADRHDLFVAKLKPNGDWDWARMVGGPGQEEGQSIALIPGIDDPNNPVPDGVVIAGKGSCPYFWKGDGHEVSFSAGTRQTLCGLPSILVARLDSSGNWLWAVNAGTASTTQWATRVAADAAGRVYLAGVIFDNTTIPTPSSTTLNFTGVPGGGTLEWYQQVQLETPYDGGVLEYSSDNGANWYDILAGNGDNDVSSTAGNPFRITTNPYNVKLQTGYSNVLNSTCNPGSATNCAWSGFSSWTQTKVDLGDFAGLSMRFRWRLGSDSSIAEPGWNIDDIKISDGASNTLFSDNLESGSGNWNVSTPNGGTPWTLSTALSHSPTHSWHVTEEGSAHDYRVEMVSPVPIPDGVPTYFIAKMINTETPTPTWQWAQTVPQAAKINDLVVDGSQRLYVAGTTTAATSLGGVSLSTVGAFVARMQDNGGSGAWNLARGATGGDGQALSLVPGTGGTLDVLLAGSFTSSANFANVQKNATSPAAGLVGSLALPLNSQCADGVDNDRDGNIDVADSGCTDPGDNDESTDVVKLQCNDGIDNDGDGKIDFGGANGDPQCTSATDDDEASTTPGVYTFVARLNDTFTGWRWINSTSATAGDDRGLAVINDGFQQAYVGGDFTGPARYGARRVTAVGASDAVVANIDLQTGEWFRVKFENWTVGQEVLPPEPLNELCLNDPVVSIPDVVIGSPGHSIPDYFFWSPPAANPDGRGHLYAVQPTTATVKWKKRSSQGLCDVLDLNRKLQIGNSDWPKNADGTTRYCDSQEQQNALAVDPNTACVQPHIAGAAVDIEPAASNLAFGLLIPLISGDRSTDAAGTIGGPNQAKFTATDPGFSVLVYSKNPASRDVQSNPLKLEVVETIPYDNAVHYDVAGGAVAQVPVFVNGAACTIGNKIDGTLFGQDDYGGRNGYVLKSRAFYDAGSYDPATRTGPILPVNKVPAGSDGNDLMAIAWYKKNHNSVAWPSKSVLYDCQWPSNPDKIIIASELGSEVLGQPALDPNIFPAAQLYVQNNRAQPGFNPNDEHALMLPANSSSGFQALFALRDDFSSSERTRTSEPYVLLRYLNAGEWAMKVYQVLATGAGYSTFQYSGVAGTPVNPPYPVRLLGNCEQTTVTGKPAFKDVKNQTWSKAAGTMAAEYWYPLQPGFWYDRDANDAPERTTGDCTAWLGGATDDPVDVRYDITWPPNPPVLTVGETLLAAKRGLPNILNQAAVSIVYDELQDRLLSQQIYDPKKSLARIIDPFEPRTVFLNKIPDSVATSIDTASGNVVPSGSADGLKSLPSHIADRVYWTPLDKRLAFQGTYDPTNAGEPVVLLNVMSDQERRRLKSLDGGDGTEEQSSTKTCGSLADNCTWDQAIEALYRLSRNPKQLDLTGNTSCQVKFRTVNFSFFSLPIPYVECTGVPDGAPDNDLLIGLEDNLTISVDSSGRTQEADGADGIPEPLTVTGFSPALTAGFAQGTGYVTLAFNNDPTLGALPVSLNVIRVDCLQIPGPNPGDPPTPSTYQGQLQIFESDNVFDEALTLRHSGDFGGNPDGIRFEWYMHPDEGGTPPTPLPDPDHGQMNGWLQYTGVPDPVGAIDITIGGANLLTLSDNWFVLRYRYVDPPIDVGPDGTPNTADDGPLCGGGWSVYAGQPGGTPINQRAQLAEGWIKRVVRGLNPFEARVKDFHAAPTNTYTSMLIQLGQRYEGDIAFNPDSDNLNSIGLIEAYTTVLKRGEKLSIGGTPPVDYAPANQSLLLAASRIADFYMLLGNEAYADAEDPMIGFGTDSDTYGTLAPTVFTFENQVDSLLAEELTLLRGRDTSNGPVAASPVYNRLFWNFTSGEGEFAYATAYNITDQDVNGTLDEGDARILFPQGHGDAWGHYLTAITTYYDLLHHPYYTWLPRAEAVIVSGTPIQVDYEDERKFAKIAAAKARVGAEVVNLTYRDKYVEDPSGQWQGYKDTDPSRAWGLSEWARRAGQGAYFDWVVGNAIISTTDPNLSHHGIQKVDRTTVEELNEVTSHFVEVQDNLDQADRGLNPLGLAKGVVPFDIDPSLIDPPIGERKTHFEQIFDRATATFNNAVATFNNANKLTELLRRTQDSADSIYSNSYDSEVDYKNRLIEIFGYPYSADIGPTGTYPTGYDGPDVYHYMYVDQSDLTGAAGAERQVFTASFKPMPAGMKFFNFNPRSPDCTSAQDFDDCALAAEPDVSEVLNVQYSVASHTRGDRTAGGPDTADSFFFIKPPEWGSSNRRSPGQLQDRLSDLLVAMNNYEQGIADYDNLIADIQDQARLIKAEYNVDAKKIKIINEARKEESDLNIAIGVFKAASIIMKSATKAIQSYLFDAEDCIPDNIVAGVAAGGDIFSAAKCAIEGAGTTADTVTDTIADGVEIVNNSMELAKEDVGNQKDVEVEILESDFGIFQAKKELEKMLREEVVLRLEVQQRREIVEQQRGNYLEALADGQRTLEQLAQFRRDTSSDIQAHRYRDMAFRIFRNDALQKYRAQFDLAARYAYLAATAYDYETNLLGANTAGGQKFLTSIVKERSLGQIIDGKPVPGSRGLAGPLGQMAQNFLVLKGQLGFNNPQTETNRFSLRKEAFRPDGTDANGQPLELTDEAWRAKLESFRVANLWDVPEFRRFCRPFAPEDPAQPQPGLVIPFETTVTFGLNFFGHDLGPGDSAYDPTHFSTRIRSVGTWFTGYGGLPLSNTPRVYLVPVGADVLRPPSGDLFATREWAVVDQALPVPFPIGDADLQDPNWIPVNDTLSTSFGTIRRFSSFRAYDDPGSFNASQTSTDSRLIGRSVWNRKWLLVIPGGTFLNDPTAGLDTFIDGKLVPGGNGTRDGNGITDIKLFFQTYAYSGN